MKQRQKQMVDETVIFLVDSSIPVNWVDRRYEKEDGEQPEIIARFGLHETDIILECFDDGSYGMSVDICSCDPMTSAIVTKCFVGKGLTFHILTPFAKLVEETGEIQIVHGEDAIELLEERKMVLENNDRRELSSLNKKYSSENLN